MSKIEENVVCCQVGLDSLIQDSVLLIVVSVRVDIDLNHGKKVLNEIHSMYARLPGPHASKKRAECITNLLDVALQPICPV